MPPGAWRLSLYIREGEIVALVGPNGAGETTLLRVISGLLRPLHGSIRFLGKNIEELPPHDIVKMDVSQVPEGRGLFPYMTVTENLELSAYYSVRKRV
jgi:branched-chain amino acid transport system ATP-binding protein